MATPTTYTLIRETSKFGTEAIELFTLHQLSCDQGYKRRVYIRMRNVYKKLCKNMRVLTRMGVDLSETYLAKLLESNALGCINDLC